MIQIGLLICLLLSVAISFKNLTSFDSRPLISILWGLSGVIIGPLMALLFPVTRKSPLKFFVALGFMTGMLFFGLGFFNKAQVSTERFNQLLLFPVTPAKAVSCRVGEESPGKVRRPEGRYFPIWNYEYSISPGGAVLSSNSDSLSEFSIRNHYKSESEAKAACQAWPTGEVRNVFFDPTQPELSLLELPKSYRAFNVDLFLGVVFSLISLGGILALLRNELSTNINSAIKS